MRPKVISDVAENYYPETGLQTNLKGEPGRIMLSSQQLFLYVLTNQIAIGPNGFNITSVTIIK